MTPFYSIQNNVIPFIFSQVHFLKGFVYTTTVSIFRGTTWSLFPHPRCKHFPRKSLWFHLCNMTEPTRLVTSYVRTNQYTQYTQWEKQSEGVLSKYISAILSKFHSYRLLFRRFWPPFWLKWFLFKHQRVKIQCFEQNS